jgi:hypothetical protein
VLGRIYRGQERVVLREGAIRHEDVEVRMPLERIAACGDGDDDARPVIRPHCLAQIFAERFRSAAGEIEQQLAALAEDAARLAGRLGPFMRRESLLNVDETPGHPN